MNQPHARSIIAAYQAALRDEQPQVEEGMREVLSDPQAVTAFVGINDVGKEVRRRRPVNDDESYFERHRQTHSAGIAESSMGPGCRSDDAVQRQHLVPDRIGEQ